MHMEKGRDKYNGGVEIEEIEDTHRRKINSEEKYRQKEITHRNS